MAKRQQDQILSKKHMDRLHREQRQTRLIIIVSVTVIVLVVLIVLAGVLYENVIKYQRAVANVNGERITAQEFRNYTKYYRYNLIQNAQSTFQIAQMFGGDQTMLQQFLGQLQGIRAQLEPDAAAENALNQLIDLHLVLQEAEKRGISVSPEEVETRMQTVLGYFPNGTPTPTSTAAPVATSTLSPTQLAMMQPPTATPVLTATTAVTATEAAAVTAAPEATLAPTEIPVTPTALPTSTPYTEEGYRSQYATMIADFDTTYEIPEETLRFIIEANMYRELLTEQEVGQLACTREQVWAQHILVADSAVAKVVQEKALAGEDWFALAAQYSTDTSNKDQGGDLGWFNRGAMVKEFEDAAFALPVGQISDPIQTQFGFHVIRALGHEDRPLTATECTTFKNEEFQNWLTDLRTNSQVEIFDFWKEIYPLSPKLDPELQQILDNSTNAGQPAPTTP